jgi:hypothetical protein
VFFKNKNLDKEVFQLTESVSVITWIALRPWVAYAGSVFLLAFGFGMIFLLNILVVNGMFNTFTAVLILVIIISVGGGFALCLGKILQRRRDIFAGLDRRHFVSSDCYSFRLVFDPETRIRQWTKMGAYVLSCVREFLAQLDLADEDEVALDSGESFESIVAKIEAKVSILEMVDNFTVSFARTVASKRTVASVTLFAGQRQLLADELIRVMDEHDAVFARAYDVQTQLEKGGV